MDTYVEFGNFQFDGTTGELIHTDEDGNHTVSRLQPQPSALLQLLIRNHPDVVSHDTIKEALWPEVHVDFEGSLHFCIRQIRSALNDTSSNPKFIENLPKRGYRWIPPIKYSSSSRPSESSGINQGRRVRQWVFIPLVTGILLAVILLITDKHTSGAEKLSMRTDRLRLAIMPMHTPDTNHRFHQNQIAFQLLEILTAEKKYEIIGPTTTAGYDSDILKHAGKDSIDYIINARYTQDTGSVLIELIRVSDGAHIWVQSFSSEAGMIERIVEGVQSLERED